MDAKTIGFAAKDILVGIGTAVAGAKGGPDAAKGVSKAGDGIDRILDNVMPGDKKQTREERFDRGDFAARPQQSPTKEMPPAQGAKPAQETQAAEKAGAPPAEAPQGQRLGDAKIAMDYLISIGWTDEKAQQILGGPGSGPLAAVVGKEVAGTRVVHSEGEAIRATSGRAVPKTDGARIDLVDGVRVPEGAQTT